MDAYCPLCGGELTRQNFFHHAFQKCPHCAVFVLDDDAFFEFMLTALEHPVQLDSLLQNMEQQDGGIPLHCAHCGAGLGSREIFVEHTELSLFECTACRSIIVRPADLMLLQSGTEYNRQREFRDRLAGKAV